MIKENWPLFLLLGFFGFVSWLAYYYNKIGVPQNALVISEGKCFMLRDVGYVGGRIEGRRVIQGSVLSGYSKDSYLNFSNFSVAVFYYEEWQRAADALGVKLENCR